MAAPRRAAAVLGAAACWLSLLLLPATAQAAVARYCEQPAPLTAADKDRLLQFGSILKQELARGGGGMALVARSGLDLSRFGMRYSHAGISLKDSADTPWAVRQLYFACDEQKPQLYDQGIAAFVLGSSEAAVGYVSVVLLPPLQDSALTRAALDNQQALQLLGASYSANAYPFETRYQNCNQWVLELLATAWDTTQPPVAVAAEPDVWTTSALLAEPLPTVAPGAPDAPRVRAQGWLKQQGYVPTVFDLGFRPVMWLGAFIPWVHSDDHPDADTAQAHYRVSMPASIEAFVHDKLPAATRIELCHTTAHVVIHRGWDNIAEGCQPGDGDTVIALD